MLVNETLLPVRQRMTELAKESPFFHRIETLVRSHPARFQLATDRHGLDLGVDNPVAGRPNRARCKVFPLGKAKLAIFFYKPSLLPYSRDRFGYGGRLFDPGSVTDGEIGEWLDFVAEGLLTNRRPARLLRGFPYDVPD